MNYGIFQQLYYIVMSSLKKRNFHKMNSYRMIVAKQRFCVKSES
ncbi:hypothetical protein LEP1GSC198_3936 [Leptospira kirschneri str. JB]|nr:hypothetical protein LEP1GSC198_3936 [Leptospira kirschneri str. JB]